MLSIASIGLRQTIKRSSSPSLEQQVLSNEAYHCCLHVWMSARDELSWRLHAKVMRAHNNPIGEFLQHLVGSLCDRNLQRWFIMLLGLISFKVNIMSLYSWSLKHNKMILMKKSSFEFDIISAVKWDGGKFDNEFL